MPQADPPTILVTGGRGFIGRHLVNHLLVSTDTTVISIDRAPITSVSRQLSPRQIEIELDIRDRPRLKEVFSKFDIDCVFDLASVTDVGLTVAEYRPNIRNHSGTNRMRARLQCNEVYILFYPVRF